MVTFCSSNSEYESNEDSRPPLLYTTAMPPVVAFLSHHQRIRYLALFGVAMWALDSDPPARCTEAGRDANQPLMRFGVPHGCTAVGGLFIYTGFLFWQPSLVSVTAAIYIHRSCAAMSVSWSPGWRQRPPSPPPRKLRPARSLSCCSAGRARRRAPRPTLAPRQPCPRAPSCSCRCPCRCQ